MTARQKEIQQLRYQIGEAKRVIALTEVEYAQAVADVAEGTREDANGDLYINDIAEAKRWLAEDEHRLLVLESQEIAR